MRFVRRLLLLTGLAFPCAALLAQSPHQHLQYPGSVAISPDGASIAWTLRSRESPGLQLTSLDHPDAKPQPIAISGGDSCAYGTPVWSPDGSTLAFLASCVAPSADPTVPRQEQIYLWSKASGEVRQLTHLTGALEQPAWSPDGKSIAFLFVENATRSAGALDAMKPWSGVIGQDNIEVQRVYAVNSTSGTGGFLTPANLHVYEFDWSPKSDDLAFIAANPPGENNWWVAKLYRERVTPTTIATCMHCAAGHTGPECGCTVAQTQTNQNFPTVVLDPNTTHTALHGLQIAVPRYSPDGTRIALIGGLMSDQGSTGGDVWVVDAYSNSQPNSDPVDITPGIDGTPTYEAWLTNDRIGFVEDRRGRTLLPDYDVARRTLIHDSAIDLGQVSVGGGPIKDAISFSPNGIFAFTESGPNQPPEIFGGTADHLHQITHLNDGLKPTVRTESVEWDNEGFHVQGWLSFPVNYDAHKKYPLIVSVHGGPSAAVTPRWSSSQWAEQGYFEFDPNPRGSFGQGEKFTEANRKDFGYGDLRDILKGMDTLEARYPIDKNREGIEGWSYGGFMTMFAVTQTHRFHAAFSGAGLSDWLSYYGENSIDQWMIPFFGASVYDDPAVYAKSSAINFIKNVTTPTLVIVGDRDGECPAPQSFEFWHALRDLGVKTELVVYPDEGHGFRNPEHIRDMRERVAKWFADNMPPSPAS